MDREYIFSFIYDNTDCLFRDVVLHDGEVFTYLPSHKIYNNKAATFIERACLSYQVNSRIEFPLQTIFYNLDNYSFKRDIEYYIIIPNSAIAKLTAKFLLSFKRRHNNVRLLALLVDSIHAHSIQMSLVKDKLRGDIWDYVLTYDKYDAEEFGYIWIGYSYYSSHIDSVESDKESDIFLIGSDKGRVGTYAEMYNVLSKQGVECNFRVFSHSKEMYLPDTDLEYMHSFMNYDSVISEVKATNCILEILQPDQKMQTIRYFESIVYNKKLLTNNPDVCRLPFYDSRYMQHFQRIDDIDINWIKKQDSISYQYNNDFSPLKLINILSDL